MSAERTVTVLTVDDDVQSRRATLRLLRRAGYRTRQAGSGKRALQTIPRARPDLIVLNDDLEGARGPEVAREIKGLPEGADIPILHLGSSRAAPGRLPEGVQLGLDGYLTRPLDAAEFLAVTRAISEARQKALACAVAARQWQGAFDALPGPVCLLDLKARLLACNAAMLTGLGLTAEGAEGRKCGDVLTELHETAIQPLLTRVQESGVRQSADVQLQDRWYELSLDPMRITEHGLVGAIMTATDITERKGFEEELARARDEAERRAREAEESRGILEGIMEHLPLAMLVVDAPEARVRMVSRYGLETAGRTAEAIIGLSAEELAEVLPIYRADGVTPVSADEMPVIRAARYGEARATVQWEVVRPDGKHLTVLNTSGPLRDRQGRIIGGVVAWQDITPLKELEQERKQLLEQAEAQRRFLEAVLNHAPGGIVVLDAEGRLVIANPAADAIMERPNPIGADYKKPTGLQLLRPDGTLYPPRELPSVRAALDGESLTGIEATVVLPNETKREVLGSASPIRDEEGGILGAIVVFQDITEQKQVQKELARLLEVERERVREAQLFEAVLESTPSAIAYVDKEARYLLVNPAYVSASGRTREEIMSRSALEFFPQPEYQAALAHVIETGQSVTRREAPLELPARPEAGVTYWDFTLTPMKLNGAEVSGVLLTATEVTDKVRTRQRIAAAERERAAEARLLTTILESMPGLVAYLDREFRYRQANSLYASGLGFTREDLMGRSHAEIFAHAPQVMEWLAQVRETGERLDIREIASVASLAGRELSEARVDVTHTPVKDDRGEVEGIVVFVSDITDKVAQREKLLETERARARLAETLNEEINHRVKNNLMMVVGLLQMQIAGEVDTHAAAALHDAMTRLLTFAEIHTQLRFAAAEEIDLLAMSRRIVEVTRSVFAKAEVDFQVEGQPVLCAAKDATPLLIVINELVTNAVKHGAPAADGKLHMRVAVRREASNVHISIWNSGNPVPGDFSPRGRRTMGMLLAWDVVVGRFQGSLVVRPEREGTLAEMVVSYQSLRESGMGDRG